MALAERVEAGVKPVNGIAVGRETSSVSGSVLSFSIEQPLAERIGLGFAKAQGDVRRNARAGPDRRRS
jgi:hypothetical protein